MPDCASTPFSHKQLALKIGLVTSTTWKSYRFVWPRSFNQICLFPNSWSGFPFAPLRQVAPSDCSSLESPKHLGHTLTEAPLTIITKLSWVLGSYSLAVFLSSILFTPQPLWLKFTTMFSCSKSCKRTPFQALHLGPRPQPRSPSCRGLLVTNSLSCEMTPFPHT